MDPTSFLLCTIVVGLLGYWLWERSAFVRKIDRIPGPAKIPIFGNLFSLPRTGHELLQALNINWVKQYGRVYRLWRGFDPMVVICSAPDIETILGDNVNINKSKSGEYFIPWLGYGLLLSGGDRWKKDRRLLTPAFHFQILDDFFEVFNRNAAIFVDQIHEKLQVSSQVEIYPMASRCTLDIICEAAMGIHINAQIQENSEYITAINRIELMVQERINSALGFLPHWIYFNLTPHGRQCRRFIAIAHDFTSKVLKERKRQMSDSQTDEDVFQANKKRRRPFLDLLLESARHGADLSDSDIMSQVDTFMFEGHDTTSAAITWFLYCMATHPDVQDRVYEEVRQCFGDSDRPCTLEDLTQLKYLECCIKEAMRRHPSVPLIRRRLTKEVTLGGHTVPAGATISIQIYGLHHNEEHFAEPHLYKPERFLPENSAGRHPFAFVPFSAGPRNCIGQKFALYEDKVVLVALLRHFRFDIDPLRYPIRDTQHVILKPENEMPLIITPRQL